MKEQETSAQHRQETTPSGRRVARLLVLRHAHVLLEPIEFQAKRSHFASVPGEPDIPIHRFLSGRPRRVLDRMTEWLSRRYPLPEGRSVVVHQIRGRSNQPLSQSRDFVRVMERWQVDPQEWPGYVTAAGLHHPVRREIALFPDIVQQSGSDSVYERMLTVRTLAHEYWHLLRRTPDTHQFLEEGGAELFADAVVLELTGFVCHEAEWASVYIPFANGVRHLNALMGGTATSSWYRRSRKATNQTQWLLSELTTRLGEQRAREIVAARSREAWEQLTLDALNSPTG